MRIRIILIFSLVLFYHISNVKCQLFIDGSYTWSKDYNFQNDDTYPMFNIKTEKIDRIPSSLGQDYGFNYFKIGIGYRYKIKKINHSLSINYNRKGAGGNFAVNIFQDEFAKELLGSILIGHIQAGGYTEDSTNYMFGLYYDNIGLKYAVTAYSNFGIKLNPFIQFDYSFNARDRIISINNIPEAGTTSSNPSETKIGRDSNKHLLSIGLEAEVPINKLISAFAAGSQSITSYTKKGEIFSNRTYITTFELGLRFYQ